MVALTQGPNAGARAVGVCNFSPRQLKELLDYCDAEHLGIPAVVQNECHPYLPAEEVRKICASRGIVFQAYASLGSGVIDYASEPAVVAIAEAHKGKTPAQVLLRWAIQKGAVVVPKSSNPGRQRENVDVFDFKLTDEEMISLDALSKQRKGQNTMVGWQREHDPNYY